MEINPGYIDRFIPDNNLLFINNAVNQTSDNSAPIIISQTNKRISGRGENFVSILENLTKLYIPAQLVSKIIDPKTFPLSRY